MRGIWAALTLTLVGVIIADLVIHPAGVTAAGNATNQILSTTYGAMLGGGR